MSQRLATVSPSHVASPSTSFATGPLGMACRRRSRPHLRGSRESNTAAASSCTLLVGDRVLRVSRCEQPQLRQTRELGAVESRRGVACLEDRTTTLIGGLAASVVGGLQVTTIVIKGVVARRFLDAYSLPPADPLRMSVGYGDCALHPLQVKSRSLIPRDTLSKRRARF